ncbi:MAG: site-specific integrase [Myxococcota bacterium]|nr:site-specific integrase [Myxococcota bacterium]
MAKQKLTSTVVLKAQAKGQNSIVWDTEVSGFGLRMSASGHKSYLVRYALASGTRRQLSLGPASVLHVAEARKRARAVLVEALDGADPLDERRKQRREAGVSVADIGERFLREHVERKRKPSTAAGYKRQLAADFPEWLRQRPIGELDRKDAQRFHAERVETPVAANRNLKLLSAICTHAERLELRPQNANPCRFVELYPERARERFLSIEELGAFGWALSEIAAQDPGKASAVAAIEFVLLTGCRRNEALDLRWTDIDLARRLAFLRDDKTSRTSATRKVLRLDAPVLELLAGLPQESVWVFPSKMRGKPLRDPRKVLHAACDRAGIERFRLHDLRHTFASMAIGRGVALPVVGKLLGHARLTTTLKYAHLTEDPQREGAAITQSALKEALNGRIGSA